MNAMMQSSKAEDKTLIQWFQDVQRGSIKLPRFQRFEAWDRKRVSSFLQSIINNLPLGITLTLEVGDTEKFESRYLVTSAPLSETRVTQQLLDGQQRLTAFWRAVHDNYENETYFVYLPLHDVKALKNNTTDTEIRCIPRYISRRNGKESRMPLWADDPAKCLNLGLIPVRLLRPEDQTNAVDAWLDSATAPDKPKRDADDAFEKMEKYNERRNAVKSDITQLRERVKYYNLPFLSLPVQTDKSVALQVFINMNTNSKPLSLYDIIVAEVEGVAEQSLHRLVSDLDESCPGVARYGELSDLILSVSALLQDKLPNGRGMVDMDKKLMLMNWPKLADGLTRMAEFLLREGIFDEARLPTNAVLAVIAATYNEIPKEGDYRGKAEKLLRRYLWSSFFTDRYENSAATRAFADYKAMKALLVNPQHLESDVSAVPVLNRSEFPLADIDCLLAERWPKHVGIKSRGILAVTTYFGGLDFADATEASPSNLKKREYHHVFPHALLAEASLNSSVALNCALITWKTNRDIGRQDPIDYLRNRVEWSDEATVRDRLRTHLISYELLAKAHYAQNNFVIPLTTDYDEFLRHRAGLVFDAMNILANGDRPKLDSIYPVVVTE